MSGIVKGVKNTFLGGAEKDAAKAQQRAAEAGQELIRENIAEARDQIRTLFPEARQSAQQGFQSALDVFGQSIPTQANIFQQGNVGAQQMLSQGLPQFQNAILGLPTDLSFAQPQQLTMPDLAFLQQQLGQQQAPQAQPDVAAPTQSFTGPFGTSFNFGSPSGSSGLDGGLNVLELLANRRV